LKRVVRILFLCLLRFALWEIFKLHNSHFLTSRTVFQQLDIDYIIGQPHEMLGQERRSKGQAAILRMFGVTEDGHSVCVHVHGFNPYFYCAVPETFTEQHIPAFLISLNSQMMAHQRSSNSARHFALDAHLILDKQSLMNFQPNGKKGRFLRIIMMLPTQVAQARGILENGIHVDELHQSALTFPTFESNILYTLRFMVDRAVVGGNWLELPAKNYRVRPQQRKASYCQIEVRRYVRSIHLARRGRKIFKVGTVQNFVRRYRVRWEKRFLPGRRTGSGDSNRHARHRTRLGFADY
jgi:DNA polymerase elongation subunit (family B)